MFVDRADDLRVVKRDGQIPRTIVPTAAAWHGRPASPPRPTAAGSRSTQYARLRRHCDYHGAAARDGLLPTAARRSVLYLDQRGLDGHRRSQPDLVAGRQADRLQRRGRRRRARPVRDRRRRRRAAQARRSAASRSSATRRGRPTARRIAFTGVAGQRRAPRASSSRRHRRRRAADHLRRPEQWAPSWSPDGGEIAFLNTPIADDNAAGRASSPRRRVGGRRAPTSSTATRAWATPPARPRGRPTAATSRSASRTGAHGPGGAAARCMTIDADGGSRHARDVQPCAAARVHRLGRRARRGDDHARQRRRTARPRRAPTASSAGVALARAGRYTFFSSRATRRHRRRPTPTASRRLPPRPRLRRRRARLGNHDGAVADGDSTHAGGSAPTAAGSRSARPRRTWSSASAPAGQSAVYLRDVENGRTSSSRALRRPSAARARRRAGRGLRRRPLRAVRRQRRDVPQRRGDATRRTSTASTARTGQLPSTPRSPLTGQRRGARRAHDPRRPLRRLHSRATNLVAGFEDRNGDAAEPLPARRADRHDQARRRPRGQRDRLHRRGRARRSASTASATTARPCCSPPPPPTRPPASATTTARRGRRLPPRPRRRRPPSSSPSSRATAPGAEGALGNAAMSADGKTVVFDADDDPYDQRRANGDGMDVYLRRYPAVDDDEHPELVTIGGQRHRLRGNGTSDVLALSRRRPPRADRQPGDRHRLPARAAERQRAPSTASTCAPT